MALEELEPLRGGVAARARGSAGSTSIRNAALLVGTLTLVLIAPYLNPSATIARMDEAYDRIPAVGTTAASLVGGGAAASLNAENRELKEQIARLTAMLEDKKREKDAVELKRMESIRLSAATARPSAATAATRELSRARASRGDNGEGGAVSGSGAATSASSVGPLGMAAAKQLASNSSGVRGLYRLTHGVIRARCNAHNIILVTFVNYQRCDYGFTWASHVQRLGLDNYLIGAMDGKALEILVGRSIPTFDMESGLTTADYGYGRLARTHPKLFNGAAATLDAQGQPAAISSFLASPPYHCLCIGGAPKTFGSWACASAS